MVRGVTKPITLRIANADLSNALAVFVSIRQGGVKVELTGESLNVSVDTSGDMPETTIVFRLSQAESLGFLYGRADVQVNWLYDDGGVLTRDATKIRSINLDDQLLIREVEP